MDYLSLGETIVNSYKKYSHNIGHEGNSIAVNHIKDNWYMLVASDHYDDNHVGIFLHRDEIEELSKFFHNCYAQEIEWDRTDD